MLIPLGATIAEEIARAAVAAAIAAATAAAKQIADVTTMPRCPEPECLPCKPPVGTVGFRTDIVPPSKPHYPQKGTHTSLYSESKSGKQRLQMFLATSKINRGRYSTSWFRANEWKSSWRRRYFQMKRFMFKYHTGEVIEEGDKVFYPKPFCNGRVSLILLPQSREAHEWGLPEGAVMLSFDHSDNSIAIEHPEQDEDLIFQGRK